MNNTVILTPNQAKEARDKYYSELLETNFTRMLARINIELSTIVPHVNGKIDLCIADENQICPRHIWPLLRKRIESALRDSNWIVIQFGNDFIQLEPNKSNGTITEGPYR